MLFVHAAGRLMHHQMLQRPHIIRLHEAFVCDSHLNIVLELAGCGSAMDALEAYTHKGAGMPESQARCALVRVPA
jgi:serine/threonine protein kinase